jgi:hypothetical protein
VQVEVLSQEEDVDKIRRRRRDAGQYDIGI